MKKKSYINHKDPYLKNLFLELYSQTQNTLCDEWVFLFRKFQYPKDVNSFLIKLYKFC